MAQYVLAIDQGTTSSRAIVFDENREVISVAQQEFPQHFPESGWVEHDPEDIWKTVVDTVQETIDKAQIKPSQIAALGITNQRETTVVWDRETGKAIYNAIVWQDRRTAEFCAGLKADGHEQLFAERTGLLLDPYFSGTKVRWILEHVEGATEAAKAGKLAFGTVDSFLLWRLTAGQVHATDATNASRTLVFNIADNVWDDELLEIVGIPKAMMPEVRDCNANFGKTEEGLFGFEIPICGIAGDQQAAAIGQACFKPGMVKSTYGTGCFALMNTGENLVHSNNRLLGTIAYRLDGKTSYALEGSIFVAGAAVQWLRDGLGIVKHASETGPMAAAADEKEQVYLVPAFTGLGAPYWDANARGAMFGLTRNTGPNDIAKAALEAVCYQTRDLLDAMKADWQLASGETTLRVDGGMVASDWTMQFLSDILNAPVDRPPVLETTALGAAWLAASSIGLWPDMEGFASTWSAERRFEPQMDTAEREDKYAGWLDAVNRTRTETNAAG